MADLKTYFQSSFESKLLEAMPDDVLQQTTPATQLLEKKQELAEVEEALLAKQEDYKLRLDSMTQRRAELERKEIQLQESLLKFDRFLKENDARRERAEKKAREENEVADERQAQIDRMQAELAFLKSKRQDNKKILEHYSKFKKYLDDVLVTSGDYASISELIDRHATLVATQKDLHLKDKTDQSKSDEIKQEMAVFREEHRVHMLDSSNKLAALQGKREKARTETMYWENQLSQVQGTATKRTLLLGMMKMATINLFTLIQKKTKVQHDLDPIIQLEKIKNYIQDLQDITADFNLQPQAADEAES